MSEIITVTGNIATDPEQRAVTEGVSVTSFRLAATHRRFDRASNAWVDAYTNYYSVSAFRALGEHAFASLKRGERVVVSGRLRLREWDNGTRKGVTAEIDAESVGHDLLFGSTTFHRSGRGSAKPERPEEQPPAAGEASETAPAPMDAAGWTIPAAISSPLDEPEPVDAPF